jgi:hypothetical protein
VYLSRPRSYRLSAVPDSPVMLQAAAAGSAAASSAAAGAAAAAAAAVCPGFLSVM